MIKFGLLRAKTLVMTDRGIFLIALSVSASLKLPCNDGAWCAMNRHCEIFDRKSKQSKSKSTR